MLPVNGLYGHIRKNNAKSLLLLGVFFLLFEILAFVIWIPGLAQEASVQQEFVSVEGQLSGQNDDKRAQTPQEAEPSGLVFITSNILREMDFLTLASPLTGALCWLFVACLFLNYAVTKATKAEPVERRDELRLYNLVENLSILAGLPRPAIYVMETPSLNAYAAGLAPSTAMIAVSRGLMERLNDRELEAVLAHEMMHIKNRDTRVVTVASLFSGIVFRFAWIIISYNLKPNPLMILTLSFLTFFFWQALGIVVWACLVVMLGGWLTRFAISRTRDYVADAGAIELTKNPDALASALRKIEGHETLEGVDVAVEAMLFASSASGALSTHPSPRDRIAALRETLPGMVSEKSVRNLSDRDDGITWEAIKAAANRTPKWVSHPYVLVPAVLLNIGVTYAVASVFDPKIAKDMAGYFDAPSPSKPEKPVRRTTPAACFPLGQSAAYEPGSTPFELHPILEKQYRAGDYNAWENEELVFAWRGKNIFEAAAKQCPAGACAGVALDAYKGGMSEYFVHRMATVRDYDRGHGAPGLAFAQGYFDGARDHALLADLRARIARKEVDPADYHRVYDSIHIALEKPASAFTPCRSEEEWRASAFPAGQAEAAKVDGGRIGAAAP